MAVTTMVNSSGYFEDGSRNGEGLFVFKTKDRYSGMWRNGKKHGQGTYIVHKTGVKITGDWVDGFIETGKWILPNGDRFEGNFKDNFPFGQGKWLKANGVSIEGEYSHVKNEFTGYSFPKVKSEFLNEIQPPVKLVWTEL
jgi:radial spoke head protein 1